MKKRKISTGIINFRIEQTKKDTLKSILEKKGKSITEYLNYCINQLINIHNDKK